MKTWTKALGTLALSGALFTTTFTPLAQQPVAHAAQTEKKITQLATLADATPVYAKFNDVAAKKVALKLTKNVYVKKVDTVTIGDDRYYLVKYDNRVAYLKGNAEEYTTAHGYIKVSDIKKVVHTYSPIKKTKYAHLKADDVSYTERYAFKKDGFYESTGRFDQVGEAEYFEKNEALPLVGEREIDGVKYAILKNEFEVAYAKKSALKKDFATNVKNYTKAQQKVKYVVKKDTNLRDSYGTSYHIAIRNDILKKGTTFNITKEATYKGTRFVYAKNLSLNPKSNYTEGWIIKDRIQAK